MITSVILCALAGWCISIALCHHDSPQESPSGMLGSHVAMMSCFAAGVGSCAALFHAGNTEARFTIMMVTMCVVAVSGIGLKFDKEVGVIPLVAILGISGAVFNPY